MNIILLATANGHKLEEFSNILGKEYFIRSLKDYPELPEIEETGTSLEENAGIKAKTLASHIGNTTIADDSGLIVPVLGGDPGIHSARYAGEHGNDSANRKLLLQNLEDFHDRSAYFECVIALCNPDGDTLYFSGKLHGHIGFEEKGSNGFGYDSIFIPEGSDRSLAEFSPEEKNQISHRRKAIDGLLAYLNKI
ncbi:MAG: RdgB/HAM1 family non-canonical purine NTP pyrophosphatase [Saprospiraceae bacterium]|nr:RdgB/HAM1 family non-canonical purine NTP pyrophosphatase [Candidatus Parvibacillus calidus]